MKIFLATEITENTEKKELTISHILVYRFAHKFNIIPRRCKARKGKSNRSNRRVR